MAHSPQLHAFALRLTEWVLAVEPHVRAKYSALCSLCLAFEQHLSTADEVALHSSGKESEAVAAAASPSATATASVPEAATRAKKHKQQTRAGAHGGSGAGAAAPARTGADVLLQLAPRLVHELARALLSDRSLGSQVARLLDTLTHSSLGCTGDRPRSCLRPLTDAAFASFSQRYLAPIVSTLQRAESSYTDEPQYARQLVQQLAFESLDPDVDELFDASAALSFAAGSGSESDATGSGANENEQMQEAEEAEADANPHRSTQNLIDFPVPALLRLPKPWNERVLLHLLSALLPHDDVHDARAAAAASHSGAAPLSIERTLALISCLKLGITAGMPVLALDEPATPTSTPTATEPRTARKAKSKSSGSHDADSEAADCSAQWFAVGAKLAVLLENAVVHEDEKVSVQYII